MKKTSFILFALFLGLTTACKKVRVCECKTTWTTYGEWGAADHEETVAQPFKDTKSNAKKQCDALRTNMEATTPEDRYTTCELK